MSTDVQYAAQHVRSEDPGIGDARRARVVSARVVKKLERTFWPLKTEFASADKVGFWAEIEAKLYGGGEKAIRNVRTAQQLSTRLV